MKRKEGKEKQRQDRIPRHFHYTRNKQPLQFPPLFFFFPSLSLFPSLTHSSRSISQLPSTAGDLTFTSGLGRAMDSVYRPPETPREPMEFLSRSWSLSAFEVSKVISPPPFANTTINTTKVSAQNLNSCGDSAAARGGGRGGGGAIPEEVDVFPGGELEESVKHVLGNPFSFASSEASQFVMDRILPQSQEVSPRTSGRLSHSSGPLNGGSLSDSPPVSPSQFEDKFYRLNNQVSAPYKAFPPTNGTAVVGGGKTVGRWLKDRREKKKEESRAQNAQLHAAVSVAGVASAVAAIAAATAASSAQGNDEQMAKTDTAMASAALLVAAQCVEAAEAMGAEREHLASVVSSAVNVRSAGDILTLTAAAATALRGAATLKARTLKEVWNIASVIPMEKGIGVGGGGGGVMNGGSNSSSNGSSFSGELLPEDNFLGICSRELLARGAELLKRTRKGDLHWKIVSVYINKLGQVMIKMKSRHVHGTFTKKKKNIVLDVMKDMPAWPGRHLLEGGSHRRYFGLKTISRGVVEFECRNQKEHDIWTHGVSRLLAIVAERNHRNV